MQIIYTRNFDDAWPDWMVEEAILEASLANQPVYTSTENVISCARALVAEGKIEPFTLIDLASGDTWAVNKYGAFGFRGGEWDGPPHTIEGWISKWAERCLRAALNQRKAEQKENKDALLGGTEICID